MKIIALQTSHAGYRMTQEFLSGMGLVFGEDFEVFDDGDEALAAIVAGERQLFITGTFNGSTQGLAEFVHAVRAKNLQVVCASFSQDELPGSFDVKIEKSFQNISNKLFEKTVQSFLDGKLHRTMPDFWHASPELVDKIREGKVKRRIVVLEERTNTLLAIRQAVQEVNFERAGEILFTQSPDEAIHYLGNAGGGVVITGDMFDRHYRNTSWSGGNVAVAVKAASRKHNITNFVILHGTHPEPNGELNAIITDDENGSVMLADIILGFSSVRPEGSDALYKELEKMEAKFPALDVMACVRRRPAMF